jgi:hypothetical protein
MATEIFNKDRVARENFEQLFFVLLLARSHSFYCLNLDVSSKARPKDCAAVNEREDNI